MQDNPQDNVTVPRELLRQALYVIDAWDRDCDYSLYGCDRDDAITSLRAALEQKTSPSDECLSQPAGEPVASIYISADGEREFDDWKVALPIGRTKLYTAPQAQQPRKAVKLSEPQIWKCLCQATNNNRSHCFQCGRVME